MYGWDRVCMGLCVGAYGCVWVGQGAPVEYEVHHTRAVAGALEVVVRKW